MKISEYSPKLYKNNIEMINIINSEEDEFENGIKSDINNSFLNTFVKTANESGIRRYEKLLEIPLDENKANPTITKTTPINIKSLFFIIYLPSVELL